MTQGRHFVRALALVLLMLGAAGATAEDTVRLTGSGASFPYPIYSTWFKTYSRENRGVIVDYQPKGSGAGIRDFINGTVDFAGSDAAMTDAEIAEVDAGVAMLPLTAGAIAIGYNLNGVNSTLRLSRDVYPAIFQGQITRWNDPRIAAENPGVQLPDLPITVVRRADSSGTTYAFTRHLTAVSPSWQAGPGVGKTVVWPDSDKFIAAPKNDGVTATIRQTPGSIGYLEFAYAKFAKVPMAALENATGEFVLPTRESGSAALAGAELPADLRVWIDDPDDAAAYPIVTYTWLLLRRKSESPTQAAALRDLVAYCLGEGQVLADRLGYIPVPQAVVTRALAVVEEVR